MDVCERCGSSEGLFPFLYKRHYLCKRCTNEWMKYMGERFRKNDVKDEADGERHFRKFVRGLWSVS